MLAIEEVLCELTREDVNEQGLPPGFRFHPTDEELITFYLASKVFHGSFCGVDIAEVDLNRCEPWELPDVAKMGEREWYFFSLRDRKYPTGLRTNRATGAGYWKATGKDREVYSASSGALLGMKKTLVFYKGRAPRGEKTKWVMHEYRLDGDFSCRHTCKEEWVICRIYHKNGDKKNPLIIQGRQSYQLLEGASSANTGCLPPLLESNQTTLLECQSQNPFEIHHQAENNLKSLIANPVVSQSHVFPINGFQPSSFLTKSATNKNTNPAATPTPILPSMLFKSLLSHQDCTWKEQSTTIPKQCKTEANFSLFQLPAPYDGSLQLMMDDKNQPNPYQHCQNPLLFEIMDYNSGLGEFSAAATAADATVHDMSTSIAFNPCTFNPSTPSKQLPGESWPLEP
ncbi:hypothetical protein FNV43_RR12106 [Rhamnella rubrinervis]|uniref:NAC domain-containing protein n=1 Tax=Rhamnella rubrinervis TaxID=2594499 RepID=A0A8K0H6S2_9ROSA|nr:hypothetical protein FNV43_RR12106 [Rhamnella rubrinervis]